MSSPVYVELGGVGLPLECNIEINQTYELIRGAPPEPVRMMNGDGVTQESWKKLKTVISARGWWPHAFNGLDFSQPMLLKCPKGYAEQFPLGANVGGVYANRRSESYFLPHGYAVVDGKLVESPVAIVSDVATVDVVAGASAYGVVVYPEITVIANPVRSSAQLNNAEFDWDLEAEEV